MVTPDFQSSRFTKSRSHALGELAQRAFRRSLVGCALVAGLGGCMRQVDPTMARAEFSSKDRSMQRSGYGPGHSAGRPALPGRRPQLSDPSLATRRTVRDDGTAPLLHEPLLDAGPHSEARVASAAERDGAASILRSASTSAWPMLRANAIEASRGQPALVKELAPKGLIDENRGVRFVACMTIASSADRDLAMLAQPLLDDESASVRAAAMLALAKSGSRVDLTPLAAMLSDNDPEVRANAYLVLGELGNPSASALIRDSIGQGMKLVNPIRSRLVDLTAAEALVKLGDDREIEPIRAALFAPPEQAELTLVACDAIGRLRDEVSRPMLERLLAAGGDARRSAEIRLSAARALAKLGGAEATATVVAREYRGSPDARLRAQVAALLGEIRTSESLDMLSNLIHDGDPTVQVAAAAGFGVAE